MTETQVSEGQDPETTEPKPAASFDEALQEEKNNAQPSTERQPEEQKDGEPKDGDEPSQEVTEPEADSLFVKGEGDKYEPVDLGTFLDKEGENYEFDVQADGETYTAPSFSKLKNWASMGIHAAQEIENARRQSDEKIRLADEAISQNKVVVQRMVQEGLGQIIDALSRGIDPVTGNPLRDEDKAGAGIIAQRGQSYLYEQRLKELEASLQQERQQRQDRETVQARNSQAQEVSSTMEEVLKPIAANFLKEDGKTVNQSLLGTYRQAVDVKAGQLISEYRQNYGIPPNTPLRRGEFEPLFKQAAAEVLEDFKGYLPQKQAAKPAPKPASRPSQPAKPKQAPSQPGIRRPATRGRSFDAEVDQALREAGYKK